MREMENVMHLRHNKKTFFFYAIIIKTEEEYWNFNENFEGENLMSFSNSSVRALFL